MRGRIRPAAGTVASIRVAPLGVRRAAAEERPPVIVVQRRQLGSDDAHDAQAELPGVGRRELAVARAHAGPTERGHQLGELVVVAVGRLRRRSLAAVAGRAKRSSGTPAQRSGLAP